MDWLNLHGASRHSPVKSVIRQRKGVPMRSFVAALTFSALIAPIGSALGHGGGSTGNGPAGMVTATPRAAADAAKSSYNNGVRSIKKAQEYDADAAKASVP